MLNGNSLCRRRRILGSFNKALQEILLLWVNMLLNRDESHTVRSCMWLCVPVSSVWRGFRKSIGQRSEAKIFLLTSFNSIVVYRRLCDGLFLSFTLKDGNMRHLVWNTLLLYPLIRNRWWLLVVILYKLHVHHKIPFQFSLDQQIYNKPKLVIEQLIGVPLAFFNIVWINFYSHEIHHGLLLR